MATPKPGEIRCPTCHRSTPPAAFCTQCGSVIPPDARIRPRGMDRDELQDRIRARRSDADPYFRGSDVDDGTGIYERFEPDPTDSLARRPAQQDARRQDVLAERASAPPPPAPPPDVTRDRDEWVAPAVAPTPPPAADPAPAWVAAEPLAPDVPADDYDDLAYDDGDDDYGYADWEEPRRRSGGSGALAVLGFLGLGVLALVAGAVLANLFGDGVGSADPTPTPIASAAPTATATPEVTATPSPSDGPDESAAPSGGPIVFPDGFTAEAQPCIPGSASIDGCASNGVGNAGSVWIWVGFRQGRAEDVIGVTLFLPDGRTEDGSIDLGRINCRPTCAGGWTYFPFSGLPPGEYQVEVTRNGQPAASTSFEVT